jgi:hypothetical protein
MLSPTATAGRKGAAIGRRRRHLYGLNEHKQHEEHYRKAYPASMRSRGYTT